MSEENTGKITEKTAGCTEVLPTAAYIRLPEVSAENPNPGYGTADRLKQQTALMQSYIAGQEELELADIYADYGNFPSAGPEVSEEDGTGYVEFTRLLEDVRCGKIRCIVVDSLSQFGRDPLETGYYVETIFPLLNVRFISITDHFDSRRESDRNSFRQRIGKLAGTRYAEEFSRKQEIFVGLCRKTGRVTERNNAYGYRFSKETGRLVIDKETEAYVRMIFAWTLSGIGKNEIAHRMKLIGAPTPGETANSYKKADWSGQMLQGILYNPVYAGFHVMGKRKTSLYRGIRQHDVERGKWLYFPDYHEPYITMDEYEELQKMLQKNQSDRKRALEKTKEERKEIRDDFRGKVMCAECNRKMMFVRGRHGKREEKATFGYYRCRSRKSEGVCSNSHVQGNLIRMVVAEQIREQRKEYRKIKEFPPEIFEELVEKIRIYGNGQRIEVEWKDKDKISV